MRPFRFGYQLGGEATADDLAASARAAEQAGFDIFSSWDHVTSDVGAWSPLAPLLAVAAATTTLRVGTLVLNNDFHHPVHLAREVATIDHLTGGRVELGLGAGHAFPEYEAIGRRFDPPAVRKARLAEAVEVLRPLLDGDEVRFEGVRTMRSLQDRLPILVGVNGKTALSHAARHADVIGITMLGRTLEDGKRHAVNWQPERIDSTIAHIRASARERWDQLELNALVQHVAITDDRRAAAADIASRVPGLTTDDALTAPFLAYGTPWEIADHLLACRQRWSISYFTVRDIEAFAPVIEMLRSKDAASV